MVYCEALKNQDGLYVFVLDEICEMEICLRRIGNDEILD
jgi:hypothetical protein